MPECIHGLELDRCDLCSPPAVPAVETRVRVARPRTPRVAGAPKTKVNPADQRLHVVVPLDDFADALATGELIDPIYFTGLEELAWAERRRSVEVLEHVVLVTTRGAVLGLETLPLDAVRLVAVANTVAQERVRHLLELTDYTARVSIHPPWFVAE